MSRIAWDPEEISAVALVDLAEGLRQIDPVLLKKGAPGSETLWFQGGEPYFDAFFHVDPSTGELQWFQLTLRGRAVTYDARTKRAELGWTHELDVHVTPTPASKLITPAPSGERGFLRLVLGLLAARGNEPVFMKAFEALARAISSDGGGGGGGAS